MRIADYNLKYNTIFKGQQKGVSKMNEKPETIDTLTNKLCEILSQRVCAEVPQNGKFSKISVTYSIPDTQNKARVSVEHDLINPKDGRRLCVSSFRNGSDRLVSSYVFKGTKQEILEYLNNSKSAEKILKTIKQLSDSVDNYYIENF